jgi:hypothetical protein
VGKRDEQHRLHSDVYGAAFLHLQANRIEPPMKRTTPLRRSSLRRKRAKPRKHVDEALRRDYSDSFSLDEIAFELGIVLKPNLGFTSMYVGYELRACDTNHIFTNPRWDLWSNFIRLSDPGHDGFHTNTPAGRVLCLAAKLRKMDRNGEEREFNINELLICRPNLTGWLEVVELPPWINRFRDELLVRLSSLTNP